MNPVAFIVGDDRIKIKFQGFLIVLDFKDAEPDAPPEVVRVNGIAVVVKPDSK